VIAYYFRQKPSGCVEASARPFAKVVVPRCCPHEITFAPSIRQAVEGCVAHDNRRRVISPSCGPLNLPGLVTGGFFSVTAAGFEGWDFGGFVSTLLTDEAIVEPDGASIVPRSVLCGS
jgi:hypothetical protein